MISLLFLSAFSVHSNLLVKFFLKISDIHSILVLASTIFISEPSVVGGSLSGHTDAVWGLTFHPQRQHLLSCAADSTVRLWSADPRSPLLSTYAVEKGLCVS